MSNNHDDKPNYKHIKALVRDLHTIKNVARPDQLVSVNVTDTVTATAIATSTSITKTNANHIQRLHSMTSPPCKGVLSIPQQLIVQQFNSLHTACNHMLDDTFIEEEDDASDTNTSSLDVPLTSIISTTLACSKRSKEILDNDTNHFSIPSVVVTDITEPLDLISSTQRRFSQLYSGLRRLSTSNTVG